MASGSIWGHLGLSGGNWSNLSLQASILDASQSDFAVKATTPWTPRAFVPLFSSPIISCRFFPARVDFAPDSSRTPGRFRHFVVIASNSTGQKVATPAGRKKPARVLRSPMWCWRWENPAVSFPHPFLSLALAFFASVRTGFRMSHTVRRQGGAVFCRAGKKASAKLS